MSWQCKIARLVEQTEAHVLVRLLLLLLLLLGLGSLGGGTAGGGGTASSGTSTGAGDGSELGGTLGDQLQRRGQSCSARGACVFALLLPR